MSRLRLGIADLFHGRPLAWGFLRGQHSDVASVEVRFGMNALDSLAREAAAEIGVDAHSVFDYFSDDLGYVLGSTERRGLAMLTERAAAAGLIECREVAI